MADIEIVKGPDFDDQWFKARTDQAIQVWNGKKNRNEYDKLLNILAGLYRHGYLKGRHDEKRDQRNRGILNG